MKFVFIHGGPGLNSNPERNLLHPIFKTSGHEILFWNEPSHQRGLAAKFEINYPLWIKSLADFLEKQTQQEPISIIAHSFGAFAVNELLPRFQDKIHRLILVAPIFDLKTLDNNILDLAIKLYAKKADLTNMKILTELKQKIDLPFGQERFLAILKALGNEEVLPKYWWNNSAAASYNQFFSEGYQFDLNAFKAIRESVHHELIQNQFKGKTHFFYGYSDPVARLEQDFQHIHHFYPRSQILVAQESGHYPHIEQIDFFSEQFAQTLTGSMSFS